MEEKQREVREMVDKRLTHNILSVEDVIKTTVFDLLPIYDSQPAVGSSKCDPQLKQMFMTAIRDGIHQGSYLDLGDFLSKSDIHHSLIISVSNVGWLTALLQQLFGSNLDDLDDLTNSSFSLKEMLLKLLPNNKQITVRLLKLAAKKLSDLLYKGVITVVIDTNKSNQQRFKVVTKVLSAIGQPTTSEHCISSSVNNNKLSITINQSINQSEQLELAVETAVTKVNGGYGGTLNDIEQFILANYSVSNHRRLTLLNDIIDIISCSSGSQSDRLPAPTKYSCVHNPPRHNDLIVLTSHLALLDDLLAINNTVTSAQIVTETDRHYCRFYKLLGEYIDRHDNHCYHYHCSLPMFINVYRQVHPTNDLMSVIDRIDSWHSQAVISLKDFGNVNISSATLNLLSASCHH